jgi:DNA-binding MarR family transcriptional regulator
MTSSIPIVTPPSLGPPVGMAERALTRLLTGVLAETATPTLTWYAFQRLGTFQAAPSPGDFRRDLRDELDLDDAAATALLDEIVAAGLMEAAGDGTRVVLTALGAARRDQIRASLAVVLGELTGPLDPGDVATTIRTLTTVTERARALAGRAG